MHPYGCQSHGMRSLTGSPPRGQALFASTAVTHRPLLQSPHLRDPRTAPALLRPFTQEEPGQGMESAAALGRSPQWSAPPERQRAQSHLQAEPAPQRAADLQAGLAAPLAIRTQYLQFTHPAVDLRGPHSACARDCQVPGHPAWSTVDEKA